jgi:glycosyltransferase involved in cell wall biosynthesis
VRVSPRGLARRLRAARGDSVAPVPTPRRPGRRGTPRVAEPVTTHVGPFFDEAVTRTRGSMRPAGIDPDYDLAYEHFDVPHFLLQARHLIEADGVDPLAVFLRNGPRAKASPEINFDMAAYVERHPERAEGDRSPYLAWLEHGRSAGELADPAPGLEGMAGVLGLTPAALAAELAATRTDLERRLLTGTLGEMLADAAEVEPLVGEAWPEIVRPLLPPLDRPVTAAQVTALHAAQDAAGFRRARLVLVLTEPRWGGGRRAEGHIAHALTREQLTPEDVVVVYTETGGSAPPGRFPDGVREVDLAAALEGLEPEPAQRVLVELVRSFRSDAVVNVNSRLLYEAMATYGRALAASERIFMMLFCNERLALGNWVGLPLRFVYRCFDLVEGVLTDSDYLADWLRDRHQLDPGVGGDRLHVLRAPVDADIPLADPPPTVAGRRPQVFWAGRFDRQKRLDLVLEIAALMPDVDVRVWGEAVLTRSVSRAMPSNVTLEGRYGHLSELRLSDADAWLYTAAWDGVPSQLLEVGMTGIPLVGSLVGGTGEVLGPDDGWPVIDLDDPGAYVAALRDVLADPAASRAKGVALRERLLRTRTEEAYAEHLVRLLLDGAARDEGGTT